MKKLSLLLLGFVLQAQTLQQIIEYAKVHSPYIKASKLLVQSIRHKKAAAKKDLLGSISASLSYTNYNIPRTLAPLVPPIRPGITTSKDITTLGASYEGILSVATIEKIAALQKSYEAGRIKEALSLNELTYKLKSNYYAILAKKSEIAAQKSYLKALKKMYRTIKTAYESGAKAKVDLLKIESEVQKARSDLLTMRLQKQKLMKNLSLLSGMDVKELSDASEELLQQNGEPLILQAARKESQKSLQELRASRSQLFPFIKLYANYASNMAKGEDEEVWSAGVALAVRMSVGTIESIESSKIEYLRSKAKEAVTKIELEQKINEATKELEMYGSQREYLRKNLDLLTSIAKIERIKYENGAGSLDDWLLAKAKEAKARSALSILRYGIYQKRAYLNYVRGSR